jgi:4'-phosphopantetheinyl transferase
MNQPWPPTAQPGPYQLRQVGHAIVISVATPDTTIRHIARARIRSALRETLGRLLNHPPEAIPLISQPGQPLRLELPGHAIGLSVSHEAGLSVAAIHRHGAVGIDLMRVGAAPDWMSDWETVALDYLGRQARDRIARHAPAQTAQAFAHEWTRVEACLKCLGLPLQEWSPALQRRLSRCRVVGLELGEGWAGALAVPA